MVTESMAPAGTAGPSPETTFVGWPALIEQLSGTIWKYQAGDPTLMVGDLGADYINGVL